MARNEEKAQSMLNKFTTFRKNYGKEEGRRPFLASECDTLFDAEKWRREIVREITKKVADIQNAGMGEHRIRDLNDQINKLLRERGHWDTRIRELGGPDYSKNAPKTFDADGRELPGGGGYKYFGAAKDLPGVRELFQKSEADKPRRSRGDLYKNITPDYYGWRDEDDGVLVARESELEKAHVERALEEWRAEKRRRTELNNPNPAAVTATTILLTAIDSEGEDADVSEQVVAMTAAAIGGSGSKGAAAASSAPAALSAATSAAVKAHVPLPDQDQIKKELLRRKKEALLAALADGGE